MRPEDYVSPTPAFGSWRHIDVVVEPDPWDGQLVRGLREETDYKATRKE